MNGLRCRMTTPARFNPQAGYSADSCQDQRSGWQPSGWNIRFVDAKSTDRLLAGRIDRATSSPGSLGRFRPASPNRSRRRCIRRSRSAAAGNRAGGACKALVEAACGKNVIRQDQSRLTNELLRRIFLVVWQVQIVVTRCWRRVYLLRCSGGALESDVSWQAPCGFQFNATPDCNPALSAERGSWWLKHIDSRIHAFHAHCLQFVVNCPQGHPPVPENAQR
jgi:hypothetical protein